MKNIDCVVIESNLEDGILLSFYLKKNKVVSSVKVFENAHEGLLYILKNKVDIAFFNIESPYALASGFLDKKRSYIPLIIITTNNAKWFQENFKNEKAFDYILKPYTRSAINEFVQNAVTELKFEDS